MLKKLAFSLLLGSVAFGVQAQNQQDKEENVYKRKFEQLDHELRSPNVYRTASGAPGPQYWQQEADYKIDVSLDDDNCRLSMVQK